MCKCKSVHREIKIEIRQIIMTKPFRRQNPSEEKFENTKGIIRRWQTTQWLNENGQKTQTLTLSV